MANRFGRRGIRRPSRCHPCPASASQGTPCRRAGQRSAACRTSSTAACPRGGLVHLNVMLSACSTITARAWSLSSTTSTLRPRRSGRAPALRFTAHLAQPRGEPEGAALAQLALHADLAAHQLGQPLGDRQAQAGAAVLARGRGVGLLERLEQAPHLLWRHADAGVAHREVQQLRLARSCSCTRTETTISPRSVNLTALLAVVDQDLAQAQRIAHQAVRHDPRAQHRRSAPALGVAFSDDQAADVVQHLLELEIDAFHDPACRLRSSRSPGCR